MNRTYNNNIRNSGAFSSSYFTEAKLSVTERFFEILSYILNAICNLCANEAVVFIAKLALSIVCLAGMFILTCLSIGGALSFLIAFPLAACLLAIVVPIFLTIV